MTDLSRGVIFFVSGVSAIIAGKFLVEFIDKRRKKSVT